MACQPSASALFFPNCFLVWSRTPSFPRTGLEVDETLQEQDDRRLPLRGRGKGPAGGRLPSWRRVRTLEHHCRPLQPPLERSHVISWGGSCSGDGGSLPPCPMGAIGHLWRKDPGPACCFQRGGVWVLVLTYVSQGRREPAW